MKLNGGFFFMATLMGLSSFYIKNHISWGRSMNWIENPVASIAGAKVYVLPDTNSSVLKNLKFNIGLDIIKFGSSSQGGWFQVNINDTILYIKECDVIKYSFTTEDNLTYLIKTDDYLPLTIYKVTDNRVVDSLHVKNSGNKIEFIQNVDWKNLNTLILFTEYQEYCGGGTVYQYVVDANDSLSNLITHSDYMDDGIEEYTFSSSIHFLENGKLILNETEDWITMDEDLNLIKTKEGGFQRDSRDSTIFFQWNGNELIQLD